MDWEHVLQIRKARELSHPENTSDSPSPASAGGGLNIPNLNDYQQMVFRLRAELIDYIEAHGLLDGLIWDGVLQPVENRKIIISADMVNQLCVKLGFMKEGDVRDLLDVYLPENHYVKDENYVHTDNNFTDEDVAALGKATADISEIQEHEKECDEKNEERFSQIESDVKGLKEHSSEVDEKIQNLTASCQMLDIRMTTAEGDIQSIRTVVEDHEKRIQTVTASTIVLIDRANKTDDKIADIDNDINEHASEIERLDIRVGNLETTQEDLLSWKDATDKHQEYQDDKIDQAFIRLDNNEDNISALIKSDVDINQHLREIDKDHRAITMTCQQIRADLDKLEDIVNVNEHNNQDEHTLIKAAIQAETALREGDDEAIRKEMSEEVTRINASIEQETETRESEDNKLLEAINEEVTNRTNALQNEVEEREAADDELRALIGNNTSDIRNLNAKYITASSAIAELNTKLITATGVIGADITKINDAIEAEVKARIAADQELDEAIKAIVAGDAYVMKCQFLVPTSILPNNHVLRDGPGITYNSMYPFEVKFNGTGLGNGRTGRGLFGFDYDSNEYQMQMVCTFSKTLVDTGSDNYMAVLISGKSGVTSSDSLAFSATVITRKKLPYASTRLEATSMRYFDGQIGYRDTIDTLSNGIEQNDSAISELRQMIQAGCMIDTIRYANGPNAPGSCKGFNAASVLLEIEVPASGVGDSETLISVDTTGFYGTMQDFDVGESTFFYTTIGHTTLAETNESGEDVITRIVAIVKWESGTDYEITLIHNYRKSLVSGTVTKFFQTICGLETTPATLSITPEDEIPELMYTPDNSFCYGKMNIVVTVKGGKYVGGSETTETFEATLSGCGTTGNSQSPGELVMSGNGTFVLNDNMVPFQAFYKILINKSGDGNAAVLDKTAEVTIFRPTELASVIVDDIMVADMAFNGSQFAEHFFKRITFIGMHDAINDFIVGKIPTDGKSFIMSVGYSIEANIAFYGGYHAVIGQQLLRNIITVNKNATSGAYEYQIPNTSNMTRITTPLVTNAKTATDNQIIVDIVCNLLSDGIMDVDMYFYSDNLIKMNYDETVFTLGNPSANFIQWSL